MAIYPTQALAKLACLYAGAIWGIFWIPLRAINEAGIDGLWSAAIWFTVPAVTLLPIALYRWRSIRSGGLQLQITTLLSGVALLFYTLAFFYTDVIRAMLLFYLIENIALAVQSGPNCVKFPPSCPFSKGFQDLIMLMLTMDIQKRPFISDLTDKLTLLIETSEDKL